MARPRAITARAVKARRYAHALRTAMRHAGVSTDELAGRTGIRAPRLRAYLTGAYLPRLEVMRSISDALTSQQLDEAGRAAHTAECVCCGRSYVENGTTARYCSIDCYSLAKKRTRPSDRPPALVLRDRVRAIATTTRSKGVATALDEALVEFESRNRSSRSAIGRRLTVVNAAIGEFCVACSPDGICPDAECALRVASPLPLAVDGAHPNLPRVAVREPV